MAITLNELTNLKFFTDSGHEIHMQKVFVLTWEFVINNAHQRELMKLVPSGYFLASATNDNESLVSDSLEIGILSGGRYTAESSNYYAELLNILDDDSNELKLTINILGQNFTSIIKLKGTMSLSSSSSYTAHTVHIGGQDESFVELSISLLKPNGYAIVNEFNAGVPGLGKFFPFMKYYGDFTQERVSTDFISSSTIAVLQKTLNGYARPHLQSDDHNYSLMFLPLDPNGELTILDIENDELVNKDSVSFSLLDSSASDTVDPFAFAVGVKSEIAGAYQNLVSMLLKYDNKTYYMGALNVKTEIEDEDERFRTLMDNFGIPDPKQYINIFEEADYAEELKDNILLNKKSKELFLTYSDIFSYVGTYKALFKAVQFLGYSDIIFKEWYDILTTDDTHKQLAVQVMDIENKTLLEQKLASYGISIEDFLKYNKLNKLTMIYQLNQYDYEDQEILDISVYDKERGQYVSSKLYMDIPLTKPLFAYRNAEILSKLHAVKQWLEKNVIGVCAYISDVTGEGIYISYEKTQTYNTNHNVLDYSTEQFYTPSAHQKTLMVDSSAVMECTLSELNDVLTFNDYDQLPIASFIRDASVLTLSDANENTLDVKLIKSNTIETPVLGDEYEFELVNDAQTGTLYEWTSSDQQILIDDNRVSLLFDELGDASIGGKMLPIITLEYANIHKSFGRWSENVIWTINESTDLNTGNVSYSIKNIMSDANVSDAPASSQYIILYPKSSDACIRYTEQNKWLTPMMFIKGYQFVSLNAPQDRKQHYLMDLESEYALEIFRGDMRFRQEGNVGLVVTFNNDGTENPYTGLSAHAYADQYVNAHYTYYSDKKPYVVINDSSIASECSSKESYQSEISAATAYCLQSIAFDKAQLAAKIAEVGDSWNQAAQNASSYTGDANDINSYKAKLSKCIATRKLYEKFKNSYDANCLTNKYIDVNVTRIGNYNVIAKSYDRYNNIYVSKGDKQASCAASPIEMNTYISSDYSSNDATFYKSNAYGEALSTSELQSLIVDSSSAAPLYPKSYRVFDTQFDTETNTLSFDNINYAVKTPKAKDLIIFENLSELCTDVASSDGSTLIYMLDENPRDVIFSVNDNITLCVYDTTLQKDIVYFGPYDIAEVSLVDQYSDISLSDDSYIKIDGTLESSTFNLLKQYLNDATNNFKVYALNTTSYKIQSNLIFEDSSTGMHCILLDNALHYNIGDVVKIRTFLYQNLEETYDTSALINEAAYRITDVTVNSNGGKYLYYLNGRVSGTEFTAVENNIQTQSEDEKLEPSSEMYISYAHQRMVRYHTVLPNDGDEELVYTGYNSNIRLSRETCTIDTDFNFADDYIDNNYSVTVFDYDCAYLRETWLDTASIDASIEIMYRYRSFPVTVKQNDYVLFEPYDRYGTFKKNCKILWKDEGYILNDDKNLNLYIYEGSREVLSRSINKYLTICPSVLGPHSVTLEMIDIYGNKSSNNVTGQIFVKLGEEVAKALTDLMEAIEYGLQL